MTNKELSCIQSSGARGPLQATRRRLRGPDPAGELRSGTQLPTHRQLAAREGVAVVTASRVYAELEAMGLVSSEQGRGTFVRDQTVPPGHGIDQHALGADTVDLNFNYPTLPGQADLLRRALRELAAPATWKRFCATNRTADGNATGPPSPPTCLTGGSTPPPIASPWSTALSTG